MRFAFSRRAAFQIRFLLSVSVLAALSLACMQEVDGERATTGECPEGEVCSDATPAGITFVGNAFYDESMLQLGPVLVNGTFDVGLKSADGQPLPDYAFSIEDGAVLAADNGLGVFGPTTDEGEPLYVVDDHLTLTGMGSGETYLRITDPATGELFDRILIEAYFVEDVRVVNVTEPDRDHLLAGCEQMVGVRLLANNGSDELRAFDQSVQIRVDDGTVSDEPQFWDCFLYDVPAERTEVTFYVDAVGETYVRTMPVRTLEEEGLTECPPVRRD